ncbi:MULTISPECIES: hypothetical protein [Roseobacteraceae]|jgi:hypothetical protein|uniref:Uncharacterized protein n=1 Tax=Pseudosulfitobacter pseudonitzschiae TaxID=1402135 RepID=A0A221JZR3_9RHOB|nr:MULTISPECIES: hypothetical protein [Roseobacteraceae]ASM72077.1 hypothetical protein SULPSESMR1_01256 [Pseudosulfitobacter pseudonitzschiae]
MTQKGDHNDPKGLILEAFRIDGITASECRSIFLDWALSLPVDADTRIALQALLIQYDNRPDHPMTLVMTEGLAAMDKPRRRGGWRSRARD